MKKQEIISELIEFFGDSIKQQIEELSENLDPEDTFQLHLFTNRVDLSMHVQNCENILLLTSLFGTLSTYKSQVRIYGEQNIIELVYITDKIHHEILGYRTDPRLCEWRNKND